MSIVKPQKVVEIGERHTSKSRILSVQSRLLGLPSLLKFVPQLFGIQTCPACLARFFVTVASLCGLDVERGFLFCYGELPSGSGLVWVDWLGRFWRKEGCGR